MISDDASKPENEAGEGSASGTPTNEGVSTSEPAEGGDDAPAGGENSPAG